jgi:hypothetical protein
MKGLNKQLVDSVIALKPTDINFSYADPHYVECRITTEKGLGRGVSICSVLDRTKFQRYVGKRKAVGRAIKALKKESSSEWMRDSIDQLPRTWTLAQADTILYYAKVFECKSKFVRCH